MWAQGRAELVIKIKNTISEKNKRLDTAQEGPVSWNVRLKNYFRRHQETVI